MNQANQKAIKRRRSTPETRAGQYMCPECGKVFDTKKEVDDHLRKTHGKHLNAIQNGLIDINP